MIRIESWFAGLSDLITSISTATGAVEPGRGYASPLGLETSRMQQAK
jgi:hypothetical protein